jgi:uncharacterized phosphosugar-binding protein
MLIERYFASLESLIAAIAADPGPIAHAARICADTLARGGAVHLFDSGHLISRELVRRAGGMVAFSPLSFSLEVNNPVYNRAEGPAAAAPSSVGYVEHVFERGSLRAGDVLFVGSVSGKTANVVELALQARVHGLTVIAVTAVAYSARLVSEHPSGKRLFETADLVLDNHAPYGDAMVEVESLDVPICPASGIGAASVLWAVVAGTIEEMLARGLKPTVFPSVNLPDGPDRVVQAEARAREKGY